MGGRDKGEDLPELEEAGDVGGDDAAVGEDVGGEAAGGEHPCDLRGEGRRQVGHVEERHPAFAAHHQERPLRGGGSLRQGGCRPLGGGGGNGVQNTAQ